MKNSFMAAAAAMVVGGCVAFHGACQHCPWITAFGLTCIAVYCLSMVELMHSKRCAEEYEREDECTRTSTGS